jgi:hypothetical protein
MFTARLLGIWLLKVLRYASFERERPSIPTALIATMSAARKPIVMPMRALMLMPLFMALLLLP